MVTQLTLNNIICKIYKILGITFPYRKNHPVLQISRPSLPVVLCQKANGWFCRREICFFTSSFSPTHSSTGQYKVSLFTLKSIFIIKKNVFFYAKEHALIFFCIHFWCYRKSPYESKYVPGKDLQERKLK